MGDLGQLIVAKDFKNLPKVQKIAQSQSGHTGWEGGVESGAPKRGISSNV